MKDLTQGNMYKNFFLFSIPIVLSSLLSSAFNTINSSIAGLYLGAEGLAATSAALPLLNVIDSLFFGHAYGLSVFSANLFGSKDYEKLKRTIYANVFLTFGAAAVLFLIAAIFSEPILHLLNVEDKIFDDTQKYFCIVGVSMVFSLSAHMFVTCCHAMGETKFPLYLSFASSVLHLIGSILVVAVWNFGVVGIAVKSLVLNALVMGCYWLRFRKYFRQLGVGTKIPRIHWKDIKPIFSYSLPNMFQQSAMYVAALLIAPVQNGLGYLALAAISVAGKIQNILSSFYYSASKTASNYIAQCVGAQKFHKIKKAVVAALVQGFIFFAVLFIPIFLFPDFVAGVFIRQSEEPEVFNYIILYIRTYLPFLCLHVFCGIFHSILRGLKSNAHLIVSSMIGAFGKMAFAMLLAPSFGVQGIFAASALGWGLECIYVTVLCVTGLWVPSPLRYKVLNRKKKERKALSEETKTA
ncbi:MAG: polysaccharide biosynthesis C-terminal domain-containing protein [Clostridia bacterium]|nr:polysaccharide biosynthesis C-terminal domain-containing protein [Clostridia bacterium]